MAHQLEIDKLTTSEKIQLMEELWSELTREGMDFPLPDWHEQELKRREQLEKDFTDWDEAKKEIRNRIS